MDIPSFLLLLLLGALFFMMGFSRMAAPQEPPENPLPECPGSPNCARESFYFEVPAAQLLEQVKATLQEMDAESIETPANEAFSQISAVFRIPLFGFRDDVQVAVVPSGEVAQYAWLHIRSASRTGYSDLGVNARRVSSFKKNLEKRLDS